MPSRPTGPRQQGRHQWRSTPTESQPIPRPEPDPVDPLHPAESAALTHDPAQRSVAHSVVPRTGVLPAEAAHSAAATANPQQLRSGASDEADTRAADAAPGGTANSILRRVRNRRRFRDTPYTPPAWWLFLRRVGTRAMSFGGPRLRRVVQWLLRAIVRAVGMWQKSLQARVVSSTIVLGLAATSVIGVVLSEQVSNRLLEARRDQAFRDSARATNDFQADMATFTGSPAEVKTHVREGISRVQGAGGDSAVGVLLLRSPGAPPADGLTGLGSVSATLVPDDLRAKVATSQTQQSRSIELTNPDGQTEPGLIVGSLVTLPGDAGIYELYFVMSLEPEQQSLDSIQQALIAGLLALVLVLGAIAWLVSRLVVNPVKEAAQVADRLANLNLDERMNPHGHDEIARLAGSVNDMADSLQEQIEAMEELGRLQRRFVSDVSHELRTPLTTIRMAAEVIDGERETFGAAAARSSELLLTQLDRFESLLADLLEISRFDAGAAALEPHSIDLGVIVRQVVELAQPIAESQHTIIRMHGVDTPARAEVESRRIERIVRNLVYNAIEHSEGKPIDVFVAADERTAAVLVVDHGVGLKPEDAERVFDRFWRADTARARTIGGTGLGLAISMEDAHLHGGTLRAWGQLGQGARFLLCLPTSLGRVPGRSPLPLSPHGVDEDEPWPDEPSDEQTRILTEIDHLQPERRERNR